MNKMPYMNNIVMSSSPSSSLNFQPITQNTMYEPSNTHLNSNNMNHLQHHNHRHNYLHHQQRHNHNLSAENHLNANQLMSNELNKFFSNNNNHIETRMHSTNNLKSPLGRKSVSPHVFYSNKTNSNSNTFIPFGSANLHANLANGNHSNIPHFAPLNHHSNQHHNEHQQNVHTTSNYLHHNNHLPSFNSHESPNLKIPTTPTRSKSLSPSLRDVIQHPRLRHKQINKTDRAENELTNGNAHHNNHHSQHVNKPTPATSKDVNKQEKHGDLKDKCKVTCKAGSFEFIEKSKTDKREEENEDDDVFSVSNKKPLLKRNEHSAFEPIVAKSTTPNNASFNKSQKRSDRDQIANEQTAMKSESKSNTDTDKLVKQSTIKLPINLRSVNLNNFPPNQGPNSKRLYSLSLQKVKSTLNLPLDKSLGILKQNIQYLLNDKLKDMLDECKKEFVDPAVRNIYSQNSEAKVSGQDIAYLFDSLVDEAKNYYIKELNKLNDERNDESKSSSEQNDSSDMLNEDSENPSNKRKSPLSNQSNDDVGASCQNEQNLLNNSKKLRADLHSTTSTQYKKLNKETKFVLGKTVNEIFLRHPQLNQSNIDLNNNIYSNNPNCFPNENGDEVELNENSSNHKSIYTKYPNLFRYEADQSDRQWLNENRIIKRKNLKCYLLLFEEIGQLFSNTISQDLTNDEFSFESISQQLKTFTLPDSILFKINKSYSFKKSI